MKEKRRKRNSTEKRAGEGKEQVVTPAPAHILLLPVMAIIILSLASTGYMRNSAFRTPVTLWADASAKSVNKRRTHENYGQALSTAGLYSEALAQFKTVLALRDDGSVPLRDLYREIGVVYFRIGLIDESIASWQTGLEHAPYDPSLLNNLSVAFLRQKRIDEAEKAIRQALAGAPNMPYALNSLGEILMIKGQFEEALKSFLQAIQMSPEGASRYWNAALAFEKTGKYDMALQYANTYAGMERNPDLRKRANDYVNRLQALYYSKK